MITRIDEKNADKYSILFERASTDIGETITNLNEYFQHIERLKELALDEEEKKPYYLRLPMDEPFFEINANTRVISVPASLRQVGVIGDKEAEILFFKIDRYYDAMDFDQCDIYIEWQMGEDTPYISRTCLKDSQSEKDKIIFGWYLGEELTKKAGTIRFAVRILRWEDEEGGTKAYNFNTLPAQISVVNGLDTTVFEERFNEIVEDASTKIFNYLRNSLPDQENGITNVTADKPRFILPSENKEVNLDNVTGLYRFNTEAVASDTGTITYIFKKDGETIQGGTEYHIIATEDNPIQHRKYYQQSSENPTEFILKPFDQITGPRYVKVNYIDLNSAGDYYAVATNTMTNAYPSTSKSPILTIPLPKVPTISISEQDKNFVISKQNYKIVSNGSENDRPNLEVVADGAAGPATKTIAPSFVSADAGILSYQWYKDGNTIAGATNSTYEVSAPGLYQVKAFNALNNSTVETDLSESIRVTGMPQNPIVEKDENADRFIINVDELEFDSINYVWMVITGDINDLDRQVNDSATEILYEDNFNNPIPVEYNNISDPGDYYLIIYTTLNGATNITIPGNIIHVDVE